MHIDRYALLYKSITVITLRQQKPQSHSFDVEQWYQRVRVLFYERRGIVCCGYCGITSRFNTQGMLYKFDIKWTSSITVWFIVGPRSDLVNTYSTLYYIISCSHYWYAPILGMYISRLMTHWLNSTFYTTCMVFLCFSFDANLIVENLLFPYVIFSFWVIKIYFFLTHILCFT